MELIVKQWPPLPEMAFIKDNGSGMNKKGINKLFHSETIPWWWLIAQNNSQ